VKKKKSKLKLVSFKILPSDHRKMKALAKKETKGNLTLLILNRILNSGP